MSVNYSMNNKNFYLTSNFRADGVVAQNNVLQKPIEKVQKTIESGVDTFVATQNEDEKKKKLRKRAIAVGSAVLVLGGLTMLLNPRSSGKFSQKIKNLRSKFALKMQESKDNFLKTKFYGGCEKVFGVAEKGGNVYFNLNSGKDVVFQSFCTNSNKKYPEFLTKNKTVHKIVKSIDDFFVKILHKPHKKITQWFDGISQYTVRNKYKSASKKFDVLDDLIKSYKDKLPSDKQALLESKLQEIANARKAFADERITQRFTQQEQLMKNLEDDLWKSIYTKDKGFMKNPTTFWVQDVLKTKKEQVVNNGNVLVEKLTGGKNNKGLYGEAIDILRENIDKNSLENIESVSKQACGKLKKANFSECVEYFDKKRDLVVGGAPTDIVSQIFGLGLCGWAVGSADKDERLQRALTTGLPVATGLASSLIFSALLYSGGVGLLAGAAVSGVTSLGCYFINKYIFGNKDKEIDGNTEQNNQKLQENTNV